MSDSKNQKSLGTVPPLILGIAGILTPVIAMIITSNLDSVSKAITIPVSVGGLIILLGAALWFNHREKMDYQTQNLEFAKLKKEIRIAEIENAPKMAVPQMQAASDVFTNLLIELGKNPDMIENLKKASEKFKEKEDKPT